MNERRFIQALPRGLMYLTAIVFGLMGLVLFLAPDWSAANFAWNISPLVAMTMGGWYLGSAATAALVAYFRRWNVTRASIIYVCLFSLTEAAVLLVHQDKLKLGAALAWPYIGMLLIALIGSVAVLLDWLRQRPAIEDEGAPAPPWVRTGTVVFVVFVLFLAAVAFSGQSVGLRGSIFPEPLSLFTLHSFGAFYFSLACSAAVLVRVQRLAAFTALGIGGMIMIVLITLAGLVYWPVFNLGQHPFQAAYLGVYILAGVVLAYYLWTQRGQPI
jgi:hypothetical protein